MCVSARRAIGKACQVYLMNQTQKEDFKRQNAVLQVFHSCGGFGGGGLGFVGRLFVFNYSFTIYSVCNNLG